MSAALEQRRDNLAQANAVKDARVQAKRRVRASGRLGAHVLAGLVAEPPPWLASMYVLDLMRWVPRVGDGKAEDLLADATIDPWRRVGRMTPRMCTDLALELHRYAEPHRTFDPAPAVIASAPIPAVPAERVNRARPLPTGPLNCAECGIRMRHPSMSGRCGFCIADHAETEGRS